MYPVSSAFLEAIRKPVIHYTVDGTIGGIDFDESNIVVGSFHITNQCTDTSDVVLGSVYTGTLTATFCDMPIARYSWVGKVIEPMFNLRLSGSTANVPLGIYTIKEAKHTAEGVEVTAYDNMIKLDKKFKKSKFKTAQKMYQHLTTICTACGLTLGMTEGEIQALPNGNTKLGIVGTKSNGTELSKFGNDIDTYRDLVFWIAQTMGCFATIDRVGQLVFRQYKDEDNVVDIISDSHRLAGAVFDDFTTNYTGIYVTNSRNGDEMYYGYDVATLTAEIAEVEGKIDQTEADLNEAYSKYINHEITEQEYLAIKATLDKKLKNLEKRLAWLNHALEKAQNEEDGLFMDLGENPILQPDGVGNDYATMRKRVLNALDAISYTPFTCSTVVGVHYDLGDVIQFIGGHATEIGETCCMMSYDFNLNGEFQMQGFGSDPSKPVIKNKNSKKADKADKTGTSATRVSTGTTPPEGGGGGGGTEDGGNNDGDLFIKTSGGISDEPLQFEYAHVNTSAGHPCSIYDFAGDNSSGYDFKITGVPDNDGHGEEAWYELQGLEDGGQYHIEFDGQFTLAEGGWMSPSFSDRVDVGSSTVVTLDADLNEHHYSGDFTYHADDVLIFKMFRVYDDNTYIYSVSDLQITPASTAAKSVSYYSDTNHQWNNIDYVRNVTQVQTSGTKIATANNSDDTTTDIYAPTPPAVLDDLTDVTISSPANNQVLKYDGSKWVNGTGGGGNDVGLSVGSNGAIQSTYTDGTEQTEDILRDDTGEEIVTLLNSIAIALQSAAINVQSVNVNYSTTEQVIGTWIDGKPLYQKTVTFGRVSNNSSISLGIQNVEHISFVPDGSWINDSVRPLPYVIGSGTTNNIGGYFSISASDTSFEFRMGSGASSDSNNGCITVRYTKTTD